MKKESQDSLEKVIIISTTAVKQVIIQEKAQKEVQLQLDMV
jgi:hypothetical protein